MICSIKFILHQNPVCTYTHAYTHTKGGGELTEAIFNLTMCNALLYFYSTAFFFSSRLLSTKFPLPLMDYNQHLKNTDLIHDLKCRQHTCKE